jgi:transitional endoplasmic reticulum ATPase
MHRNFEVRESDRKRMGERAMVDLLPTQMQAMLQLEKIVTASPVTMVSGDGVSALLRRFAADHGAPFMDMDAILHSWTQCDPESCEIGFTEHVLRLMDANDLVVIDSVDRLGPSRRLSGPKFALTHLVNRAWDQGKRIVAGHQDTVYIGAPGRARWYKIPALAVDDIRACLERAYGAEAISSIDFEQIDRMFGSIDCHGLERLGRQLGSVPALTTQTLGHAIEVIRGAANIVVDEVEKLSFDALPGTGHIAEQLETHVLLPLERPDLARELDIRPKRGVLLYGPPGTGKTSIGRALAHRMGGRFFLIDGTIPTDPPQGFFQAVARIVEQAKRHAPSVLFIDDADMLFDVVNITGIARYLLTLLDGMESEGAGKVCVMMTAMNVNKVPAPILRSGRVELWLSTNHPDADTRAAILQRWVGNDLPGHDNVDYGAIAARVENCTPADLRRVVGDARTEFAADRWAGRTPQSADDYLSKAADELVAARARMARHLRDDSLRIGTMREAASAYAGRQ